MAAATTHPDYIPRLHTVDKAENNFVDVFVWLPKGDCEPRVVKTAQYTWVYFEKSDCRVPLRLTRTATSISATYKRGVLQLRFFR